MSMENVPIKHRNPTCVTVTLNNTCFLVGVRSDIVIVDVNVMSSFRWLSKCVCVCVHVYL